MQPGSSRSEPKASTSIALRNRSRASGFTRTFTHIANIAPSFFVGSPRTRILRERGRRRPPRGIRISLRLVRAETRSAAFALMRSRPPEDVLAEIGDDHIARYRGGPMEAGPGAYAAHVVI